jgi:phage gp45-like
MSAEVKTLLQKINFIESDMELHKQILLSIPSKNKKKMEKVINTIADQKKQINELRLKIKKIDRTEYDKIIAIEQAAETFKQISKNKNFISVSTLNESGECYITLNNGNRINCLVVAKEENGNFTILTIDGETKEYPGGFVK